MRKLWLVLGIVVVLVLLAGFVLPYFFFDAETQRRILSGRIEDALGRKVKLGKMRLGLFPPALRVEDAEIAERLGFPGTAFSTAKQLRARVNLIPLLRGRLEVPSVELDEPTINLVKNAQGEWNFAEIGKPAAPAGPGAKAAASTPLEIGELQIRNGTLNITDLQRRRPTVTFTRINVTLKDFSPARPFDWEVSVHPPGPENANIEAKGRGGPVNRDNLAESPAQGEAKFENVELAALSPFTDQPGLSGLFHGDAKFTSDGKAARADGAYRVERLRLSSKAGMAQAPVSGRFQVNYDSAANRLNVQQFQLGSGAAVAHTTGHLLFAKSTAANLDTRLTNAPLADVARVLPALGVKMPAGSSLSGGTLTAQMQARGPVQQPHRRGSVEVRNARLANYNVAGKLGSAARLAGVDTGGKDTVIELFKTSFTTDRGYTRTPDLLLVIPGMQITADGGFSDAGALNFQGTATLTRAGAAGAAVGGLLQKVTGASNTIPFRVTGTLENPVFMPDVGKMATQRVQEQAAPGGAGKILGGLGGIFGRKK